MGKRNVRILRHQLSDRREELLDREVHIILLNSTTFFGKVLSTDSTSIEVQDINARWTNKKKHTHKISMIDIMEVIFDVVAEY